jgi:hypothetical protein
VSPYESMTENPRPASRPDIRRDPHVGLGGLEWVLNACTLAVAAWSSGQR